MTFPTIPDLPVSSQANDSDQMLIRQPAGGAGTDKSIQVRLLRGVNISALATLPSTPLGTDLMLISRGGVNYKIEYSEVSFVSGTKCWFFADSPPDGWAIFGAGDTLLGVKGGATYLVGGNVAGTWQQTGHALTLAQIPPHSHRVRAGHDSSTNTNNGFARRAKNETVASIIKTNDQGNGQHHDHGAAWRPLASVGIICIKD